MDGWMDGWIDGSNIIFLPPTLAQLHFKQLAIIFYKFKKSTLPYDIQTRNRTLLNILPDNKELSRTL